VNKEFNIAQNIRFVDELKSGLLNSVAELFSDLIEPNNDKDNRTEIMANIICAVYLLGSKTGIENKILNNKIIDKLRLNILEKKMCKESLEILKFIKHGV
jgi:septal ring factor EnvC (AmiA/AmiB activator)